MPDPIGPLTELQTKQREIMGGVYYRSALESNIQGRLVAEAELLRADLQKSLGQKVTLLSPPSGKVTVIDPQRSQVAPSQERTLKGEKKREDAEVKVAKDYRGDWDQAKDIARCTLVVEKAQDIDRAFELVKKHFSFRKVPFIDPLGVNAQATPVSLNRNALQYHYDKVIKPEDNNCGYSGYTVFVRSGGSEANKAEIQINYVAMMYAKSLPEFRNSFNPDKERELAMKYNRVPGGLGHALYEVARKPGAENSPEGIAYAAACKLYYDYFRSEPPDMALGVLARNTIDALQPPLKTAHVLPPPPTMVPSATTAATAPKAPSTTPAKGVPSWLVASQQIWKRG
jgi:hypothetical protein